VSAYSWDSGDNLTPRAHGPRTPKRFCVKELSGSDIVYNNFTSATFTIGFTTPVFSGTAQTGWTKQANIDYVWHRLGRSCGNNGTPPHDSAIVAQ
jgi:hypothetical protein